MNSQNVATGTLGCTTRIYGSFAMMVTGTNCDGSNGRFGTKLTVTIIFFFYSSLFCNASILYSIVLQQSRCPSLCSPSRAALLVRLPWPEVDRADLGHKDCLMAGVQIVTEIFIEDKHNVTTALIKYAPIIFNNVRRPYRCSWRQR